MVGSLLRYRSFIWQSALAELRHRYAGTGLGVFWNVVQPLALIAVFSLVFTGIMRGALELDVPGVAPRYEFLLYLCCGLLPWLALAECVTRGCNAFAENAAYLKKLPIPEQVFVAQSAASATLGLGISFCLLIGISLLLGLRPTWHWMLLPLPLAAMQLTGFALGLLCGTLNVFFRDVGQVIGFVLQLAMFTAPVVYAPTILPEGMQNVLWLHPVVPPLNAVRELFLYGQSPDGWVWAAMIAWPAVLLVLAGITFGRLRTEIRDMI